MAWIFGDSFDHYLTADVTQKWTTHISGATASNISAVGRRGTNGYHISANNGAWAMLRKTLAPSGPGFVVGFYVFCSSPPNSGIYLFTVYDANVGQVALRLNTDYTISMMRGGPSAIEAGGAVLQTSGPSGLTTTVGGYIECKCVINDTTGSYAVRVNGNPLMSGTNVDTQASGSPLWAGFALGAVANNGYISQFAAQTNLDFDDLYLLDQSGSAPYNDFLGDVRADWHPPNGPGTTTQFTPTPAVANYLNVDDATANGDTDCNTATAVGQKDTFALADLIPAGAQILCVQHIMSLKKTTAGLCTVAPVWRHAGLDYPGTAVGPSTAYGMQRQAYVTNPGTGLAWTELGFNAAEIGYTQVS